MKVLIVGNDLTLAHNLRSLTTRHSLEIESDKIDAVKDSLALPSASPSKAASGQYDLIVIDACEPGGIGLCQQLRAQNCQTLIVLLTESGNSHQAIAAFDAGANDYLIKPCDAAALITRAQVLGHYSLLETVSDGRAAPTERRKQTKVRLQQQLQRAQLTTQIMDAIRQTLDLTQILNTAVEQVRNYLNTDRVIVFRFNPNWQGVVEAESVGPGLTKTLGMKIQDLCFGELYAESYRQGRVSSISDLDTADFDPCHVELLSAFEVRANLVVPILQGDNLWGLLIAHHCCAPRQWTTESTQLLQQVATQMGIALHQAELYQRNRQELIERRQIQAALEQSEERFRSLSAFAPVGIYQTDLDGQCTYTNARWQEIAGLTFVESLGDRWVQAIHPDDRARVFAAWRQLVNGESDFELEFRFLTRRGQEHWVFGRAIPMLSNAGEVVGYVGVNEDITHRKLAEQQIRQQAALIDIASDAIFVRDLEEGRIVFWSKGATQLYGWHADEAVGTVAHDLLNKSREEIQEALETTMEKGSWQGELIQRTKAGEKILVASRWTLIKDEHQVPQSLLTVNTDITEEKQLEAQVYEAQRLESLGRLAGGIAHDLGNVLTPILGIAQLLRLTQTDADGSTQEQLDILEKSAKRGTKMVRQILTFAQGSSEEKTTVNIDVLLQEVIDVARQGFPRTIEICQVDRQVASLQSNSSHPDGSHPDGSHPNNSHPNNSVPNEARQRPKEVSADSTHLHQVFMNLCINACDAMPNGGVLTLSVEHCFVDDALASKNLGASSGDHVVVTVSDTGIGISPEIRDRIFDPFFTTKGPDKGTGLGLATVSGIIKKVGGFLQVSSEVGQGTQVSVYLPALNARTASAH